MKNKTFYVIIILLLAAGVVFWSWMFQNPSPDTEAGAFEQVEITEKIDTMFGTLDLITAKKSIQITDTLYPVKLNTEL